MTTAELRGVQVELLDWFVGRCEELGLRYQLFAGTLLGAARHQGYIPWDDDIDVSMPREDHDRLCAALRADPPDGHVLLTAEDDPGYPFPFTKIGLRGTVLRDSTSGGLLLPVNIDVFALDGLPGPRPLRRLRGGAVRLMVRALEASLGDGPRGWRRLLHLVLVGLVALVGRNRFARTVTALARRGSAGRRGRRVEHVAAAVWGPGWQLPVASLEPSTSLPFEGRRYAAPGDWDDVLRRCYGSWRELPAAELQVSHHVFEGFWNDED